MSLGELAAFICTSLKSKRINCVLTGGACVSIYSENKFLSYDLDFIDTTYSPRSRITKVMEGIGFTEENRYYKNPETDFIVEFPAGPVSAGSEPIIVFNEIEYSTGNLVILTPTDSVKDRLAAYYHWNDMQALEQAKLISANNKINSGEIKRWSAAEGFTEKYNKIKNNF